MQKSNKQYHWSSSQSQQDCCRNEGVEGWIELCCDVTRMTELTDNHSPLESELFNHPSRDEHGRDYQ